MTKLAASTSQGDKNIGLIQAISSLKNQIKQQNKLINTLLEGTNNLNLAKKKSKSPHVKEAIDMVVDAAEANRPLLHGAFYEADKVAARASTQQKQIPLPLERDAESHAKQDAILKVCEELKASVAKQQEDINQPKRTQTPTITYAQKCFFSFNTYQLHRYWDKLSHHYHLFNFFNVINEFYKHSLSEAHNVFLHAPITFEHISKFVNYESRNVNNNFFREDTKRVPNHYG